MEGILAQYGADAHAEPFVDQEQQDMIDEAMAPSALSVNFAVPPVAKVGWWW
jgi:hypothetical protein